MQTVYYHRKGRSLVFSLAKPLNKRPAGGTPRRAWKQNPVTVALKLQEQLNALSEQTHGALAEQLGISRGRVCQYLRLLDLPSEIISFMVDADNSEIISHSTERNLQTLLKAPASTDINSLFRSLFQK